MTGARAADEAVWVGWRRGCAVFYRLGLAAEHFRYFCGRVRDKVLRFRPADRVRIIEVLYKRHSQHCGNLIGVVKDRVGNILNAADLRAGQTLITLSDYPFYQRIDLALGALDNIII